MLNSKIRVTIKIPRNNKQGTPQFDCRWREIERALANIWDNGFYV